VGVLFNFTCDSGQWIRELDSIIDIIQNISELFVHSCFLEISEDDELFFLLWRYSRIQPQNALEVLYCILEIEYFLRKFFEVKLLVGEWLFGFFIEHMCC
jgi:hypothetical protein